MQTDEGREVVRSTVEPAEQLVEGADIDESDEATTEREVYRTRPQMTITLLNEHGQITDMSGDAALADFIAKHKSALLNYLDRHFSHPVWLKNTIQARKWVRQPGGSSHAADHPARLDAE